MNQQPQQGSAIHLMERVGPAKPGEITKIVVYFPRPMLAADAEAYLAQNSVAVEGVKLKSVKPLRGANPNILCVEREPVPLQAVQTHAPAAAGGESEDVFEGDSEEHDIFGG